MHYVIYIICGLFCFVMGHISRRRCSIGLKVCTMVELYPGQCFSPFGGDI